MEGYKRGKVSTVGPVHYYYSVDGQPQTLCGRAPRMMIERVNYAVNCKRCLDGAAARVADSVEEEVIV